MIGNIGGRRRASGVSVIQGPVNSTRAASAVVTFSATPTNGDLIVLVAYNTSTATISAPAGFTAGPSINQGGSRPLALFWKVAASESGAAYTLAGGVGTTTAQGYLLRGAHATAPIGNGAARVMSNGTTGALLSAAVNISAGSIAIAFCCNLTDGSGMSFDNSFSAAVINTNGGGAYRLYPTAASSQNSTATWTNSTTNVRGALVEILKA